MEERRPAARIPTVGEILTFLQPHRGKVSGAVGGVIVASMVMRYGLGWTGFILLCGYIGYRLGKHVDEEKEGFLKVIERYLPPGGGR